MKKLFSKWLSGMLALNKEFLIRAADELKFTADANAFLFAGPSESSG